MQAYVVLFILVSVTLFVLIQWFLSLRHGRGWGLVMPAVFLVLLIVSQTRSLNAIFGFLETSLGIVFNDTAYAYYTRIAVAGLLVSLALYGVGIFYLRMKRQYMERRRAERLAAKRATQAKERESAFQKAELEGDFSSIFNSPKGE